jgi:Skp family chaperone for outer membrane proteins
MQQRIVSTTENASLLGAAAAAASDARLAEAQAAWNAESADRQSLLQQNAAQIAQLQEELQQAQAQLSTAAARSQEEKQQLMAALSAAQLNAAQGVDQLQPLRAQVQKYVHYFLLHLHVLLLTNNIGFFVRCAGWTRRTSSCTK